MDFREMLSKRPQFEVKYINEDHWEKLSEKDALLNLHKAYAMITPIISRMFRGEEIATPSAIYRIRSRYKKIYQNKKE
jgi:hypothetical protein